MQLAAHDHQSFFFSSRRRHTRSLCDWSSDVCSSDLMTLPEMALRFILNNLDVHTTIPGMRKPKHVASNLAASDQGPLPAQLHAQLRPHRWVRTPTKWSQ